MIKSILYAQQFCMLCQSAGHPAVAVWDLWGKENKKCTPTLVLYSYRAQNNTTDRQTSQTVASQETPFTRASPDVSPTFFLYIYSYNQLKYGYLQFFSIFTPQNPKKQIIILDFLYLEYIC